MLAEVALSLALSAAPGAASPRALAAAASESSLARGRFLIATRQVAGAVFAESVVLLLDYGPGGALGLIVNRPTRFTLAEALPQIEELRGRDDRAWLGGPVAAQRVFLLGRGRDAPEGAERVLDDVWASMRLDALKRLAARRTPASRLRAYLGYAGWAPGQLDAELARGDWYVEPADAGAIFDADAATLWRERVRRHEGIRVRREPAHRVARTPLDPRVATAELAFETRPAANRGKEGLTRNHVAPAVGSIFPFAGSAEAGTLTTPYIFQGGNSNQNVCIAVNVGKAPIEVTVEAVPLDVSSGEARRETSVLQPLNTATVVPSDPPGTCATFMNAAGFCRFTAPGSASSVRKNLRAVMVNRDTSLPPLIATTFEAR
jgi:putative transcriptional regulator